MTLDQALVGASSIVITVFAARALSPASFGHFALVQIVYIVVQVAVRAVLCDPLLVHPDEARTRVADVLASAMTIGAIVMVPVLAAGLVAFTWDPDFALALIILGVCMPGLTLQDVGRYLGFANQRPGRSLALDAGWLVAAVVALAAILALDVSGTETFVLAWAGSGVLVGLSVVWLHRQVLVRPGIAWLRTTWGYSWRYLLAVTSSQAAVLIGSTAIGVVAGARALGAVRGAQLLYRPFQTLNFAAVAAGTNAVARMRTNAEVQHHVRRTTAVTTVAAAGNAVVLLALPDAVGRQVLGATWGLAEPLLLPAAVQIVLVGLMSGVRSGLFGLKAPRKTLVLDSSAAALVLTLMILGAVLDGAAGAMWALALGQIPVAVAWWATFVIHLQRRETVTEPR